MSHGSEGHAIHFLAQFQLDPCTFRCTHSVDKKDPLQVIVFMLNGASQEPIGLEFQNSFVQRLRPDPHGTRTGNVGSSARKAQAAFDAGLRFAESFDFGIDQDKGHMGSDLNRIASDAKNARPVFDLSDVDNAELNGHANLLGRQTDSVRVVHRFQHILNECTDPGVYFVDPFSLGPQRGMAVLHDLKNHGVHYGARRRLINFNELLFLFLRLGKGRDILDARVS